jgi:hypothetical protein
MAILKNGEWKAPFWGKAHNVIGGRDPLGMQSSSVATYGKMLPGLTNLTDRIRYYGFFSWIMKHFQVDPVYWNQLGFTNYIRRCELLFAYINLYDGDITGISGSDYVHNHVCKDDTTIADLANGADYRPESTYWKLKAGSFGQYYLGSMQNMGLVKKENNILSITTTGEKLAAKFEQKFSAETKSKFFSLVEKGRATGKDIGTLSNQLRVINIEGDEKDFYHRILLAYDHGFSERKLYTELRKKSLTFILKSMENGVLLNLIDAPKLAYKMFGKDSTENRSAVTGWYYYQLNEYCHYAIETIFWGILFELQNRGNAELSSFMKECAEEVLKTDKFDENWREAVIVKDQDKHLYDLDEFVANIKANMKAGETYLAMANGFAMLFKIHLRNVESLEALYKLSTELGFRRDGDCLEVFSYLQQTPELELQDLILKLIQRFIIDRHMLVAYRKMGLTNQNSLKFHIEDGIIWFRNIIEPVWTTPRLKVLGQILVDLDIINELRTEVNTKSEFCGMLNE